MKKSNMTKIKQIEYFQTRIHTFCLLMPLGDFHHHALNNVWFKSPKKHLYFREVLLLLKTMSRVHLQTEQLLKSPIHSFSLHVRYQTSPVLLQRIVAVVPFVSTIAPFTWGTVGHPITADRRRACTCECESVRVCARVRVCVWHAGVRSHNTP